MQKYYQLFHTDFTDAHLSDFEFAAHILIPPFCQNRKREKFKSCPMYVLATADGCKCFATIPWLRMSKIGLEVIMSLPY